MDGLERPNERARTHAERAFLPSGDLPIVKLAVDCMACSRPAGVPMCPLCTRLEVAERSAAKGGTNE